MNDELLAVLLAALGGGVLALGVPALIGAIPEPETDDWADEGGTKTPYATLAEQPSLRWRSVLAGAVAGGLLGWSAGLDWPLAWLVPLVPVCVALSVIDSHTRLLPRVVVVAATIGTAAVMAVVAFATDQQSVLWRALLAMLAVRSFFWLLWFIRSAGMGFGDVRLAALVGLVLGWVGWGAVAIGVWVGFLAFALPGLVLAVVRRDRALLRKPFPYGPFMLLGALVGLVWGADWAAVLWP